MTSKKIIIVMPAYNAELTLEKTYQDIPKEKISEIMNKKGVENYVVLNGERVRFSNRMWVSCGNIPKDGEEIFKKTLDNI